MWLLSTSTLDLHYFQDVGAVPYAILSHTWEEEEVSFQEMRANDRAKREKGYKKIEKCCQQARVDGYEYAWVDTCWYGSGNIYTYQLTRPVSIRAAVRSSQRPSTPCSTGIREPQSVMCFYQM
jgi:hypothetical protein